MRVVGARSKLKTLPPHPISSNSSPWVSQGNGKWWEMDAVVNPEFLVFAVPSWSLSIPSPAWVLLMRCCPSQTGLMCASRRLQFFKNCCNVGLYHGDYAVHQERTLNHESPWDCNFCQTNSTGCSSGLGPAPVGAPHGLRPPSGHIYPALRAAVVQKFFAFSVALHWPAMDSFWNCLELALILDWAASGLFSKRLISAAPPPALLPNLPI